MLVEGWPSQFGFVTRPGGPYGMVVAGGAGQQPVLLDEAARLVAGASFCVAADGGLRLLRAIDRWPHVLVGDFDTLTPEELDAARQAGVEIRRFPTRKDATDSELALDLVARRDPSWALVLVGGVGDRIDHSLANMLMACRLAAQGRSVVMVTDSAHMAPLIGPQRVAFRGWPGQIVSLIPLTPQMTGVSTDGLAYPLRDATLQRGVTFTVSNHLVGRQGAFEARTGHGLVVLQRHREQDGEGL